MTDTRYDFWAITSYFNLTNSRRRLENYRCFRRRLSVPLLTVEWNPERRFQLKDGDADVLLQLGGGDLMWQKERLLTIAVAALPEHVNYAAWVDCDVLFENRDWKDEARALLESKPVVQLFSEVALPDENESRRLIDSQEQGVDNVGSDRMLRRDSFLGTYGRLKEDIVRFDLDGRFQPDRNTPGHIAKRPARGLAWAAQTAFLRKIGFYDRCIMGGGDVLFCYGISGLARQLVDKYRTAGWAFYGDCASYRRWTTLAAETCDGRWGYVSGRILHLFHGNAASRQYRSRIDGLIPFALDLDRDISAGSGEPWSWRRDRDRLNEYFLDYMRRRDEDGGMASGSRAVATG